jgi:LemA protein
VNPIVWLIPTALTAGAGVVSFLSSRRAWAALDTPTIQTGHVVIGRVEVKGKAGPGTSGVRIVSPLSAATCVWWRVEVEEETGSGKDKSWKTRHKAESAPSITVDDGSGPITVDLRDSSIKSPETNVVDGDDAPPSLTGTSLTALARGEPFLPTAHNDDRGFFSKIFSGWDTSVPIAALSGNWRITETYVPDGADMYVLGSTSYDEATSAASFARNKDRPLYVYCGTEKQLTTNARRIMIVSALVMLGLAYVSVAMFFGTTYAKLGGKTGVRPNWARGPIGPTLVLMAMFAVQVIRIRNRIVAVREQREAAKRLVGIAEKKRSTLVPQLTAVVQAAASHEQGLQQSLATLRGAEVETSSLMALAEASPTLRADANFRQLQTALVSVENDIAVARGFEAEANAVLRTRVQSFPDSLVAPWLGIKPSD